MLQIGGLIFVLFDNFINYAMKQTGLTKYKLAKRIGVSQSTVANWMNGTSEPRDRKRAEVLEVFGVDERDLEEGFPIITYKEIEKGQPADDGKLSDAEVELFTAFRKLPESYQGLAASLCVALVQELLKHHTDELETIVSVPAGSSH